VPYFESCLASIRAQHQRNGKEPFQSLHILRQKPGWLSRIVQAIANSGFWTPTRYAFPP
jgi:hypothetical protein